MTPLAHAIVADSTLPTARRKYGNAMRQFRLLDDEHFFQVTAVTKMAFDVSAR